MKSSNLSFDIVTISSSFKLMPNLVIISPAPPYPSHVFTYASIAKLSLNDDDCISVKILSLLTILRGKYITSIP